MKNYKNFIKKLLTDVTELSCKNNTEIIKIDCEKISEINDTELENILDIIDNVISNLEDLKYIFSEIAEKRGFIIENVSEKSLDDMLKELEDSNESKLNYHNFISSLDLEKIFKDIIDGKNERNN